MTQKKWHGDEMVNAADDLIALLGDAMDKIARMKSANVRRPIEYLQIGMSISHDLQRAYQLARDMAEVIRANNRVRT